MIVSGRKLAYLEPQEKIWKGESGQWFDITELRSQGQDGLAPFDNVCGFSASMTSDYCGTLFRFPLRDASSELSETTYTVSKLHKLLAALKEEAKFLLLFLRSIDTIEVFELTEHGEQALFRVEIAERQQTYLDRKNFMDQLKSAHERQSYSISQHINVVTDFHVTVADGGHTTESHWLIANQVGSQSPAVQTAAMKQHVFPLVGVALELKDGSAPTSAGRIFCFLPMPAEASSPLPVHVNGTFGLNDDRRTLKWPGIERKNDPTAEWNTLLVNELLPPCYALLLDRAKDLIAPKEYYSTWPEVVTVQCSNWSGLLLPLFRILVNLAVVWTERSDTMVGRWILPNEGVFVPREGQISPIVHRVLSSCEVKLVNVPPRIWDAFQKIQFSPSCITPSLTRNRIRIDSSSYMNINADSKCELLRYCLTDQNYSDLQKLFLLPLADGKFEQFISRFDGLHNTLLHYRYVCSADCPQDLLPNISERLVDVQNDSDLQNKLQAVARCGINQLRNLDTKAVAQLLPDCFPTEWHLHQTASLPHPSFPSEWFETFWRWVRSRDLHCFAGQLILPVVSSKQSGFEVTRLKRNSPVLFLSEQCSADFLEALTKLQVCYTNTSKYPYLDHKDLHSYVNELSPAGILTAIANAHQRTITEIQTVILSSSEASAIQLYLSTRSYVPNSAQKNVLSSLPVLSALNRSRLYSACEAARSTWNQKILVEPEGFDISHTCLPSNLVIFSQTHNQRDFLKSIPGVRKLNKSEFILKIFFPMIKNKAYPDHQIDSLMEQVLQLLPLLTQGSMFVSELRTLPFLKTTSNVRKSPSELFDPSQPDLKELYQEKSVFPTHPFDQRKYRESLLESGLRISVNAKEIVEIIQSNATSATRSPQKVDNAKISRAKAVLKYLSSHSALLNEMVTLNIGYGQHSTVIMKRALLNLASQYNWLPVLCLPPADYPECLFWKGKDCTSHLTSLNKSVLFPDHVNRDELPTITGSQVYVVDCFPSQELFSVFPASETGLDHVLMHFRQVIDHSEQIDQDQLNKIVHMIYRYLYHHQGRLSSATWSGMPQWIWIKKDHTFVSPSVVALKQNYRFRQNLEPYLYILPDDLQQFSSLFVKFGVTDCVTQSQIVSVLEVIKDTDSRWLGAEETWSTVMSILNWLTDSAETAVELTGDAVLYVPVESDSELPQLMQASDVVYTDNDFLKNFLASEEQEYTFVHRRIQPHLAHLLGLTPLTKYLHIAEDTFEDVGQYETLTQRLKNILREYDGGLTIIKELIQNADDAEASEINICYDARTHNTPSERLLYPGMAECHGPALVVHNDASFTDEDFQNIQKLAAATKEDKPLKIGKFGVGFCSVYHITDVPSFVSQDSMFIFDPTLKHLKKEIKNPARPGKKIKFTERIVTSSQQLEPFAGLYNFHSSRCYDGTMFRFPFRTSSSEISGIIYNETVITKLKEDIQNSGSKLLLFLQHVKRITFSSICAGKPSPEILVDIRREDSSTLENVVVLHSIFRNPVDERYEHWLVSSHTDTVTFNDTVKYGTAAVACQLNHSRGYLPSENEAVYTPAPITGEVFCFLPLTLHTGLPVHVSANFAVMNSRKGIRSSDEESCTLSYRNEIEWNVNLMKEIIPKAYLNLLTNLQRMCSDQKVPEGQYLFYSLWPLKKELKTHNPWVHFIDPLYKLICSSNLFYSSSLTKWQTLAGSKILSPGILCQSTSQSTPDCVLKAVEQFQLPVVELPSSYQDHIPCELLNSSIFDEKQFLSLFFESIEKLGVGDLVNIRNKVLKCVLQAFAVAETDSRQRGYIQGYLKDNACIPCSPDGQSLKKVTETIDPKAPFAELYDPSDRVFPLQEFSDSQLIYGVLIQLGMISSSMPWSMLIERARTISDQYSSNKHKALRRVKIILDCTSDNLLRSQQSVVFPDPGNEESRQLSAIKFLPVLQKPSEYPLQWCGEDTDLLSPKEMLRYSECNVLLVGSQLPLVCEESPSEGGCGPISPTLQTALEIQTAPKCDHVLDHFGHLIEVFESRHLTPAIEREWVGESCSEIYGFFQSQLSAKTIKSSDLAELQHKPCVWSGKQFVLPSVVAENWSHNGPYLFRLPFALQYKPQLITALRIKKKFMADDFLCALQRIHEAFGSKPVDDNECKEVLFAIIHALDQVTSEAISSRLTCFLPDSSLVMHDAKTLVYNDAPWCEADAEWTVVHGSIVRSAALKFGVKPVRSKLLQKYESKIQHFEGVAFGQREELTQRIQNILREYPFDVTVLKELLQNADDSKATKMYVILDMRQHGTRSLPSDEWKDLQGPALLVWNDSVFSEEDLKGIQQLGLGNKRTDSESIGMYGIGFNVVYHLTDCPSFISNGTTLCVLDPHCRYVPGADILQPGRRYDNLDERFWSNWADLKPAYLRDEKWPEELKGGSLFRFPLRSTQELVKNSEIVGRSESWISGEMDQRQFCITELKMENLLKEWIPQMKKALFFLNHVTELKFFTIRDGHGFRRMPEMQLIMWFKVSVDQTARKSRAQLHTLVREFKGGKSRVSAILYPLTITEKSSATDEHVVSQNWIIQQGVGDLMQQDQQWMFSPQIKPKHGIAACIDIKADAKLLSGAVFCFLPLPITSRLPVHVNGAFILDATRRNLWRPTDPNDPDNRMKWNLKLMEAIASSYSKFLVDAQKFYVKSSTYTSGTQLWDDIQHYYSVFPTWLRKEQEPPEGVFLTLAKMVYIKLASQNEKVLASIKKIDMSESSTERKTTVFIAEWHPLLNEIEPSRQGYFWKPLSKERVLAPILESIGMTLLATPILLQEHFADLEAKVELPIASRQSVYQYYSTFYHQVSETGFPCHIRNTAFQSTDNFRRFTEYLLKPESKLSSPQVFPHSPFSLPLLLTADEQLRIFDEQNKAIKSGYVVCFPKCQKSFLHPNMLKMNYVATYFLKPSADNWRFICSILSDTLPASLKTKVVQKASQHINFQHELKLLWQCFSSDPVFQKHIEEIVSNWALLPSTDDQLFSFQSNDQLLPLDIFSEPTSANRPIVSVLRQARMPFLDTSITGLYITKPSITVTSPQKQFCPKLSNHARVLANLYCLYQKGALEPFLASRDIDKSINTLFEYFSSIHFAKDHTSLHKIKSIPLFKNIDGMQCTLLGDVYVWPGNTCICQAGREKWVKKANVVFLIRGDVWTKLGSASVLGIQDLTPLQVYTRYIFPHFGLLNEEEQLEHLRHIRDGLHKDAEGDSESKTNPEKRSIASQFLSALKALPCLMHNGTLKPVSEFCDPDVEIFSTFKEHFLFPSKALLTKEWLMFFRKIGLQTEVSKEIFIQFCHKVSTGGHKELRKASSVLAKYIFGAKDWYQDLTFLHEISEIPFVCTEALPDLSWIQPVYPAENRIQSGSTTIDMTKLCGAVLSKESQLVWTVKPVVRLPYLHISSMAEEFYKALGIIRKPNPEDVIQNILNISETRFSHFSLFDKYTPNCQSPEESHSTSSGDHLLLKVLQNSFTFLMKSTTCPESSLEQLMDRPCIPVCSQGSSNSIRKPVLVRPLQVIASSAKEIEGFRPFINPLPSCLYSVLPNFLSKLGVVANIQLTHIRLALETAYKNVHQSLDPNTTNTVKKLLRKLHSLLQDSDASSVAQNAGMLQPLYLPNTKHKLVESKFLLLNDRTYYKHSSFNLSESPYSLFSLLTKDWREIGFSEKKFCKSLPSEVSPKALSACIDETLNKECSKVSEEQSPYAKKLEACFGFPVFATFVSAMLQSSIKKEVCAKFRASLEWFLRNIEVITMENLRTDIMLRITQPPQNIGTAKVDFLLQKTECSICLYIDDSVSRTLGLQSFEALVHSILLCVAQRGEIDVKNLEEAELAIELILKAESEVELYKQLEELQIPIDDIEIHGNSFDPNLDPKLGARIPESWLHRLDCDSCNIFRPEEWVGYEVKEGVIVFAIVIHRIVQSENDSDQPNLTDQYLILTDPDDQEGKAVSILDLYKFIRSAELKINQDGSQTLCPFNPDSQATQLRQSLSADSLKSIKRQICEELKRIWKLPEDQRRKAIKRLYLKWHPDKNSDPLATKAFQYLQRQIARLEAGIPLEEPEEEDTKPYEPPPRWRGWYDTWDSWAGRAHHAQHREQAYYSSRGGYSASGGSTGESTYTPTFTARPTPEPVKGRVWIKQAEADMIALRIVLAKVDTKREVCCHVCFLAHEVAERALKAGKYAVCGLHSASLRHHDLVGHAGALEQERRHLTVGLQQLAQALQSPDYYLKTRFPNQYVPHAVPAEQFSPAQAREAATCAEKILDMMKRLVEES